MNRAYGIVALLLVVLCVALAPAAYADPPDRTWMGGYWDDDDFDTVVVFISDPCAIALSASLDVAPFWGPVAGIDAAGQDARPAPRHADASSRAPPLSAPLSC